MIHPQERAIQRYNKELKFSDLSNMRKMIKNNEHMILGPTGKEENRFFAYLTYNNIPYKVVYDNNTKNIITVYPFIVDEYNKLVEEKEEGGIYDYFIKQVMNLFEVENDKTEENK